MMDPACILVAANLCLSKAYIPASTHSGMIAPKKTIATAAIHQGVKIEIHFNDVPYTGAANLMDRRCRGTACIYHFKHCDKREAVCDYYSGELVQSQKERPRLELQRFSIKYTSQESLAAAESQNFLAFGRTRPTNYIALSELRNSARLLPPSCSTLNAGC